MGHRAQGMSQDMGHAQGPHAMGHWAPARAQPKKRRGPWATSRAMGGPMAHDVWLVRMSCAHLIGSFIGSCTGFSGSCTGPSGHGHRYSHGHGPGTPNY